MDFKNVEYFYLKNFQDAHNCVVDLHTDWHMFGVYDGHGGTEVSKFTSAKLPDFLKERKFWEADDVAECLQKAFVDFDDFIRAEESMKELKDIGDEGKPKKAGGEADSEDEADRIDTIEEASVPLAELLKRYGGAGVGKSLLSAFLAKGDVSDDSEDEDEDEEEAEEQDDTEEKKENEDASAEVVIENAEDKEEEEGSPKKKGQKRCQKSPIQSEAKKSKSETDAETAPSSSSGVDGVATEEEDEDDSDKEFVADEEEDDEDAEDEQSDEEMVDGSLAPLLLGSGGAEVPGEDSGTTACVCLVGKDKVIVANAGDSRAVLCRNGKAVDLSVDHKPEDEVETNRIHAAGGQIEDGRVNGGLNLSRAFGDHAYKKNQELGLKEQMITALPDVKIEALTPEDEFIVVACDGIWNSMESQQVVDFVRDLLAKGSSCAEVCDALCDACLADSTDGDGTGCDNMTVICTTFDRKSK
ncbi:Protein phosphatase ppm-1.G [Caenorhabditis elegans]|uniref:Isoform b of Protein phosphatase ppm-1.G n=1 Tax=Caenorhabditis elegans TaxID=6239 RepID=P49595-2|nr:Protein phosphatase ppm-1.G [Caenorhabditis elegans]CCD61883.1 Protein phosphatase ppm-1.G [Caenorhabditis elegans]|eukprot:NP_741087.1 Probable protein phosphatase 2C F42G9.1 [Caenorhabditis elegans]